MSEGKWTPGPWKVAGQGLDNEIEIVTTKLRGETVCVVLNDAEDVAVWPDAYLIAAAPELYEALKAAEGHLTETLSDPRWHPIGHCPVLDMVRAALAKATPSSPDGDE